MIRPFAQLAEIARCSFWTIERAMIIDPGESATLILIVERILQQVHVREHITIPNHLAPADSIVPETVEHLRSQYDPIRIYLILSQSETVSQRISLEAKTIEDFIAGEAERFQKIEGTEPVFDHQALHETPTPREHGRSESNAKAWWLTYCQEPVLKQRLQTLGLSFDDIDDATSATQGLWGAFESLPPSTAPAHIVDIGRQHTALLQIRNRQPQAAASFSFPLDSGNSPPSPETLARWHERLIQTPATLSGNPQETLPLTRQDRLLLLGETALIEPIATFLRKKIETTVILPKEEPLSKSSRDGREPANQRYLPPAFAAALGVARAAFGLTKLQISLLPKACRQRRDQKFFWNRLRGWTATAAAATLLLLLFAITHKTILLQMKDRLLSDIQTATQKMTATEKLLTEFAKQYEQVRPILRSQQKTAELIETFAALQPTAQDPAYWLVLLADFDTYYAEPSTLMLTNKTETLPKPAAAQRTARAAKNRRHLAPYSGFVAEFSFLDQGEAMRTKLLSLVNRLNDNKTYRHVDTLAEDIRRPLAKTNILLPGDRHVALLLELHRNYFDRQLRLDTTLPKPAPTRKTVATANRQKAALKSGANPPTASRPIHPQKETP